MEYHLDGDGVVLDEADVGGINDSNGTGEDDGLPPLAWRSLESPAAALASRDQLFLASLNGGTLLTLSFYSYVTYAKVEIAHPVFAVVFQELLVLLSLQLSSFLFELFSGLEFTDNTFPTVCNILALHFHQWSWLGIACLRYRLLSSETQQQAQHQQQEQQQVQQGDNLPDLRRRSLLCTWAAVGTHVFLSTLVACSLIYYVVRSQGKLDLRHSGFGTRVSFLAISLGMSNLPDFASIAIYFRLRRRLMVKVAPMQQPRSSSSSSSSSEGTSDSEGGSVDAVTKEDSRDDDGGVFPGGAANGPFALSPTPPPPPLAPQPSQQANHQSSRLLRALRLHASTALFDLTLLSVPFVRDPALRIMLTKTWSLLISYWIPLLVIRSNFQQMDNMMSTFCILVC